MKIQDRLRACLDDPMWADHVEVNKVTLQVAVDTLNVLECDAARYQMLLRMAAEGDSEDEDLGQLGVAADEISHALEEQFGHDYSTAHTGQMLTIMLDRMIEKFGSTS